MDGFTDAPLPPGEAGRDACGEAYGCLEMPTALKPNPAMTVTGRETGAVTGRDAWS